MKTLYAKNGIMFWTEQEIQTRKMLENFFVLNVTECLKKQNRGFEVVQVEAPLLTPREFINPQYDEKDMFVLDDLVLRPETTMGSYVAARELLDNYRDRKFKLPLVVWQHGKSFRREQDQPSKFMRLKEFYQLEFQIMFSPDTKNDYSIALIKDVTSMIEKMIGPCRNEPSDRIPTYAEWTKDVICSKTDMEVCSMSKRKDFDLASVLEVAIGTDRCVSNMLE
jgi:glycyl-tRNA synthetase